MKELRSIKELKKEQKMKNKIIDKYIERIKLDFPEDDKLMIDLQDFAKEILDNDKNPTINNEKRK